MRTKFLSQAMTLASVALVTTFAQAQSWTALTSQPPAGISHCLLLTDGGVMCQGESKWYKLAPDSKGSYLNGTWSSVASLPSGYAPDDYVSAVLADGRVVIVGGEGNNGDEFALTNMGAVYDPAANTWTLLNPPPPTSSGDPFQCIGDAPATVLPDGRLIIGSKLSQDMAVLDPATSSWSIVSATGKIDGFNSEEGWTLLPDGSFFTLDVLNAPSSERFLLTGPATGVWVFSGNTPQDLHTPNTSPPLMAAGCPIYNPPGEIGPTPLLPNGTVFAVGANGFTGIYTPPPPRSTAAGSWAQGPQLPAGLNVEDGPSAVLPNGHVLFGASPGANGLGLQYFEFDGISLTNVPPPAGALSDATNFTSLLVLPTGEVMFVDGSSRAQLYTPASPTYNPAWAPTITVVPLTISNATTYQITGTQFNGVTQGTTYGDEFQNATNYPLVRITNNATGRVVYAKTHDHSTMGVATGAATVFTNFDVPLDIDAGASQIQVIANGIPSAPVAVTVFTTVFMPPQPFADEGQAVTASLSSGSINLVFPSGFAWTATSNASWLTLSAPASGTGSGTLSYQVAANAGAGRSATITAAGYSFIIVQQAASIPGLTFVGSVPHIAAEENWTTAFTFVNAGPGSAMARLNLFGDPGGALNLPLAFPQQPAAPNPLLAASLDQTLSPNASLIIDSAGPQTPPVQIGSAQLAATGAVDGFAIFHLNPGAQEAVVPMEKRNASSYLLAFDNTGGVVLGVAVANVSAQAGIVGVVIRDDGGTLISSGSLAMSANGHTSFVLSMLYPETAGKRGTIQLNTSPGGQISVLGIRTTPLGNSNTLTTIPALANVGTNGGSIAQIATGNGWQTTFVLVNTGSGAAQANLNFFADVTGVPLSLPVSFPQVGAAVTTVNSVSQTLAAGASLLVQSAAPLSNPTPTIGSAQLTTSGNVSGFVIFRYNPNGQEAVVPLESRAASAYILAFDNTNGTATGVAINSVSSQTVDVPVIVRDDTGAQIATDSLNLAANGHLAFTLGVDKYPATAKIRGTIEFDTPVDAQIGVLGIRIPVAHTFTTLPSLAR